MLAFSREMVPPGSLSFYKVFCDNNNNNNNNKSQKGSLLHIRSYVGGKFIHLCQSGNRKADRPERQSISASKFQASCLSLKESLPFVLLEPKMKFK